MSLRASMVRRGRRRSVLVRVLFLAFLLAAALSGAARAQAQDAEWVVLRRAVLSPSAPLLELNSGLAEERIPAGTTVRVRLHGSVTDGFDGAEIDALGRGVSGTFEPTDRWVGRPPSAHLVSSDATSHDAIYELGPNTDLRFSLNVVGLAGSHLVTASEMRGRLDGSIEVQLLVPASAIPEDAPISVASAPSAPEGMGLLPYGVGGGGLLAALALGFFFRKRTEVPPEVELEARAKRAHQKLVKDAKGLGPQFEGVVAPGDKLLDAAKRSRDHLSEIDRSLKDTAFVKSAAAEARLADLREDRKRALERLSDVVSGLEEAVVRLAASRADRAAVTDIAGALSKVHDEVSIGREVDAELR